MFSLLTTYPQLKILQDIVKQKKIDIHLVGGFLRDHILGRLSRDFDFAVEKDALELARIFADAIKGAYVLLDEQRGCARVVKKMKGEVYTFDFADFRDQTFLKDLSHRDFTINTLSLDLSLLKESTSIEDILFDFKGALKDIESKRIKRISVRALREDPLRMMRAFSLKASLGFKIELSTLNQISKECEFIYSVSPERVRDELFKVLASERAGDVLKDMDQVGLLEKVMPQVRVMFQCTQGGYHHLDVWNHSLEAVVQFDQLVKKVSPDFIDQEELKEYWQECLGAERSRLALTKLAVLLHDIGKPDTRKKREEGGFSFHGHEGVGKRIVKCIAKMLKLSTKERHALEDMIMFHLRPGYLSNFKTPGEKMIYRYLRDAKEEAISTALLSLADQRATRGPLTKQEDQEHHQEISWNLVKRYFDKKKEKPFVCLLDGNDLIKTLKLKPSPLFTKILLEVSEQQVLGKVTTKKEALDLAKRVVLISN